MRRLYAVFTLVGVMALVISLGGPWWLVSLEGGAVVAISGLPASPLASSLLAAGAAAFGLGLLLRGPWRRIVSVVQLVAVGGAVYALAQLATRPERAALGEIASLTGIAGAGALEMVTATTPMAMLVVGLIGLVGAMGSAILGVLMPDKAPSTNRYARSVGTADPKDSIAAWDHLSEGSDPTTR